MQLSVKIIGALCILAASFLLGMELDRNFRRRPAFLREMYELLTFLEKEMTFHRAPVPEALRGAARQYTTELSQVLLETAKRAGSREGGTFAEIWRESAGTGIPAGLLSEEELLVFLETSEALCSTDTVMQRTLLQKYAARFETLYREEAETCREKCLLVRRLSAAAGVFLVILLL